MIVLRNFRKDDAVKLNEIGYSNITVSEIEDLISEWNKKSLNDRYFEMFAIISGNDIVGTISLYKHSSEVISIGPEIFGKHRKKGFAKEAMRRALNTAREKGYKIVSQQILTDNTASIALHSSLGFETNGLVYTNAKGHKVAIYLKSLI